MNDLTGMAKLEENFHILSELFSKYVSDLNDSKVELEKSCAEVNLAIASIPANLDESGVLQIGFIERILLRDMRNFSEVLEGLKKQLLKAAQVFIENILLVIVEMTVYVDGDCLSSIKKTREKMIESLAELKEIESSIRTMIK